ncbi:hypothetical protein D3C80_906990 [compost metagenome]
MADHLQVTLANLLHHTHGQTGEGRRIEGTDIDLALTDEIVGAAAMKGLVRIGHEEVRGTATGSTSQVRTVFEDFVQALAVVGSDVLHITHVLVAPFDLERTHTGFYQRADVGALVVVLHRQQVFLVGDHPALFVFQGVRQAAGLGTVATVGTAAGLGVGNVALAGEGHAQRTVNEKLDRRIGFVGDGADFLEVQFAGQNQLRETGLIEELCPSQGADVGLGTGMQLDRRDIQLHHPQVLDDQRVNTSIVQLMDQLARGLQLIIVEDGVDGGEDPRMVAPGKLHQLSDFAHLVTGIVARAEAWATDVHSVGAMQDGLTGDGHIAGGAEQFQVMLG